MCCWETNRSQRKDKGTTAAGQARLEGLCPPVPGRALAPQARDTHTDRHTHTDTQTDTETDTHTHRQTDRQTDTHRQTHRQTHTDTETDRQTDTDRHRQTETDRDRLNAKRPVCQSNQSKDAYQNSLAVAEHHRARWAHVNLSRSIAHTLVDKCAIKNFISAFVLCCVCVQVFFAAPAHYALHC